MKVGALDAPTVDSPATPTHTDPLIVTEATRICRERNAARQEVEVGDALPPLSLAPVRSPRHCMMRRAPRRCVRWAVWRSVVLAVFTGDPTALAQETLRLLSKAVRGTHDAQRACDALRDDAAQLRAQLETVRGPVHAVLRPGP